MNTVAMTMPDTPVTRNAPAEEPRSGDVIVSPDPEALGKFTIRQMPGGPSLSWDSREKAIGVAQGFARSRSVDVWFQSGRKPECLHRYRSTARESH